MGEGISEGFGQELDKIENPSNIQNNLEGQPVGGDKDDLEEENLTVHTTTASGQVSKPPACLIKEIGEATPQMNKIIILLSVSCWKKMNVVALELVSAVGLTTQTN